MEIFMKALTFAAHKHRFQTRKNVEKTPYINHPIGVAAILTNEAKIFDYEILSAALLHDTIEDTDTTLEEVQREFGSRIAGIVNELTDDKSLEKQARKQAQIDNAKNLSHDAVIVRLADKIYNLRDLNQATPVGWSEQRVTEYFQWSSRIARQIKGHNEILDQTVEDLFQQRNI